MVRVRVGGGGGGTGVSSRTHPLDSDLALLLKHVPQTGVSSITSFGHRDLALFT